MLRLTPSINLFLHVLPTYHWQRSMVEAKHWPQAWGTRNQDTGVQFSKLYFPNIHFPGAARWYPSRRAACTSIFEQVGLWTWNSYLIFVIFFTQTRFLENKIYTEECVNYDKRILRQNSINWDLLDQANNKDHSDIFCKYYTHCIRL